MWSSGSPCCLAYRAAAAARPGSAGRSPPPLTRSVHRQDTVKQRMWPWRTEAAPQNKGLRSNKRTARKGHGRTGSCRVARAAAVVPRRWPAGRRPPAGPPASSRRGGLRPIDRPILRGPARQTKLVRGRAARPGKPELPSGRNPRIVFRLRGARPAELPSAAAAATGGRAGGRYLAAEGGLLIRDVAVHSLQLCVVLRGRSLGLPLLPHRNCRPLPLLLRPRPHYPAGAVPPPASPASHRRHRHWPVPLDWRCHCAYLPRGRGRCWLGR